MKIKLSFLVFLLLISLNYQGHSATKKEIVISGKVIDFQQNKREIEIFANRIGFKSLNLTTELDSLGNFYAIFESSIPTDIGIRYKEYFLVLANPGDSINIELNGSINQTFEFFNNIKIIGDNATTNQNVVEFQKRYFSSKEYNDWNTKQKAVKELDSIQYLNYLNLVQQKRNDLYNDYAESTLPDQVAANWSKYFLEQEYYNDLFSYPFFHAKYNGQPTDSYKVPIGYFDTITNSPPITDSTFICAYSLNSFINNYSFYITEKCWAEKENQKYKERGRRVSAPVDIMDSIEVYRIIKYTPDTLLRQILLTNKFSDDFRDYSEIECFEKYQNIVEKYINLPFLKRPLYEQYNQLKERLANPQYIADIMTGTDEYSTQQLIDSILKINTGKIIYIDCWATWCGPCKAEMPNSKKLMTELKNESVAFVYLCLKSQEKIWKENLSQLEIGGQHYLLNTEQSNTLYKAFDIQGIPFYILLNKNGQIVEKGSHLRPDVTKEKIEVLLNE